MGAKKALQTAVLSAGLKAGKTVARVDLMVAASAAWMGFEWVLKTVD